MNYSNLPQDIQAQIKANLSCFDKCTVEKTDSGFEIYNGICLHNGKYNETIEVKKQDVYTYAEWCAAFEQQHGYAPSEFMYKAW